MRVRLTHKGLQELGRASAYLEFVTGRPSFDVEDRGEGCYLHRPTGCTFSNEEVEPAHHEGPGEI